MMVETLYGEYLMQFFGGSFGDMPFAPRPGGIVNDSVNDPVNSNPEFFAGETSTTADHKEFFGEFKFKSATGEPQQDLRKIAVK